MNMNLYMAGPPLISLLAGIAGWIREVPGLLSFGRQGLYAHDNTHHALAMAQAAVDCLAEDGSFDDAHWTDCRTSFEAHVVED